MLYTRRRDIVGILLIVIIAVFAVVVFKLIGSGALEGLRLNTSSDWQDLETRLKILGDNTRDLISPPRKRPYSILAAQETLNQLLPQVFDEFQDEEWDDFWDLIYGIHERDDYGPNYSPKRKRQLSIEEIEEVFSYDYPDTFGRFNSKMWQDFWKIVFKKY